MARTTREKLLVTARKLFSDRGFYGVSIANVADEHGLSKQALLHYFASKEKLYGAVLEEIAQELALEINAARAQSDDSAVVIKSVVIGLLPKERRQVQRMNILARELLDNPLRAKDARIWYLDGFLRGLTEIIKTLPAWSKTSDAEAFAMIYQLLGAVCYYSISGPTLQGIFKGSEYQAIKHTFPQYLDKLIDASISGKPFL